jgi:hypothetical protein
VRPRATALFAFNDISALGAIRAVREAGLRVPEDVSVLGFDDIPSAVYQRPGLASRSTRWGNALPIPWWRASSSPRDAVLPTISLEPSLVVRGTTAWARPGS